MPKRVVVDPEELDRQALRAIAVQIGRALSLTVIAATAKSSIEDEAIAAMDRQWEKVADLLIAFAERG